jgi:hypothetical protein
MYSPALGIQGAHYTLWLKKAQVAVITIDNIHAQE